MAAAGPFVGKIFDDYGPRYLLSVGAFLHVFGLMMTSISKKYYQFLLSQAICSAIGASMVFYPGFTCVRSDSNPVRTLLIDLLGIDLVLSEARRCHRSCCSWILFRRRHFPHHGRSPHSRGRLRLGNAYLCFPNIGTAHFRKFNCALSHCTNETSIQPSGFHPSSERADFRAFDRGHFLLLLKVKLYLKHWL